MASLLVNGATLTPLAAPEGDEAASYIYDPETQHITETSTVTTQRLERGRSYRTIQVEDSGQFPDQRGFLCFGHGYEYETGPVPYVARPDGQTLLLDQAFRFPREIPAGARVNLLGGSAMASDGCFWNTPSQAGRVAAAETIDSIAAGGYEVTFRVLYPGDYGLGGEGAPTGQAARLTDAVEVWGGDDLDAEVEAARAVPETALAATPLSEPVAKTEEGEPPPPPPEDLQPLLAPVITDPDNNSSAGATVTLKGTSSDQRGVSILIYRDGVACSVLAAQGSWSAVVAT